MIQKLFWKLFPPYEVTVTCNFIKAFTKHHCSLSGSIIKQGAIALAKDAEKTVYSIRCDHLKPDHLALILITNIIGNHVSSGSYHIYRGMLNLVGADMVKAWGVTMNDLLKDGYYTQEEVNNDNKWIEQQIKSAG